MLTEDPSRTTSDAKNGADEAHEPSTRDGPQTDSEMRGDTTVSYHPD